MSSKLASSSVETSRFVLDVLRVKKLPPHPEAFRTVSPSVKVTLLPPAEEPSDAAAPSTDPALSSLLAALTRTSRIIPESADAFFNETFEFDLDALIMSLFKSPPLPSLPPFVITLHFEVFDNNVMLPTAALVATGSVDVNVADGVKGDKHVPLQAAGGAASGGAQADPSCSVSIKYAARFPKPKPVDVNIDVDIANRGPITLTSKYPLCKGPGLLLGSTFSSSPATGGTASSSTTLQRGAIGSQASLNVSLVDPAIPVVGPPPSVLALTWYSLANDDAWVSRFTTALRTAVSALDTADGVPLGSGRKGSAKPSGRAASTAASGDGVPTSRTIGDVAVHTLRCRRPHQFVSRVRVLAARFHAFGGGNPIVTLRLPLSAQDEVPLKQQWKEYGAVALVSTLDHPKIRELSEKLWAYLVADINFLSESALVCNVDAKMKMNTTPLQRASMDQLQATLLERFIPGLRGMPGNPALLAAREELDLQADALVQFIAARLALAVEQEAAGVAPRTNVSPTAQGFLTFFWLLRGFAAQWLETLTDFEAQQFIIACYPAVAAFKDALAAAAAAQKALSSSTKPKRTGSASRR